MSRKRKKEGINLLAVIIIIIVVIAIVSVIISIKKNKDNNKNEQNELNKTIVGESQEEQQEEKYVQILEDGTKLNISSKFSSKKKIDDLEISNIQLTYRNGITNLLATVENKSNDKMEFTEVEIELVDENGDKIHTLKGILQETESGKTTQLNCSVTADFANAYDFKITKK